MKRRLMAAIGVATLVMTVAAGTGAEAAGGGLRIFSPSLAMADYYVMGSSDFDGAWNDVAGSFDVLNLHGSNLNPDNGDSLTPAQQQAIVDQMARLGKDIAVEVQSVSGLQVKFDENLNPTALPEACSDTTTAFTCGEHAAVATYELMAPLNGHEPGIVKYLLLDSAFYDAYYAFGYHASDGQHSDLGRFKTLQYYDGFSQKMKQLVPGIELVYISHFKYEYVNGQRGLPRTGTTPNTEAGGGYWTDEEDVLDHVMDGLPGRFDRILFDVSWTSLYMTGNGFGRWETMIDHAKAHGLPIGTIVHTDGPFNAGSEPWFHEYHNRNNAPRGNQGVPSLAGGNCSSVDAETVRLHNEFYIEIVETGRVGDSQIARLPNHHEIDDVMVANWHKQPYAAFDLSRIPAWQDQACTVDVPLAEIMKAAG